MKRLVAGNEWLILLRLLCYKELPSQAHVLSEWSPAMVFGKWYCWPIDSSLAGFKRGWHLRKGMSSRRWGFPEEVSHWGGGSLSPLSLFDGPYEQKTLLGHISFLPWCLAQVYGINGTNPLKPWDTINNFSFKWFVPGIQSQQQGSNQQGSD